MSYKEACVEALVTAENEQVDFDTIELVHPFFLDDNGQQMSVRLVLGHDDIVARLENTAMHNPSEMVTFYACDFDIVMPSVEEGGTPQLQLKIANVDRKIGTSIEEASQNYDPITLYYRPYLFSNLAIGPEVDPPFMFELADVTVDAFVVSGTATLDDVNNYPFPNKRYLPAVFKALVR